MYELRLASYGLKTVSNTLRVLLRTLLSFSRNNCVGMAHMVWPHLDKWTRALCRRSYEFAKNYRHAYLSILKFLRLLGVVMGVVTEHGHSHYCTGTADTTGHFFFHSSEKLVLYLKLLVNFVFFFWSRLSQFTITITLFFKFTQLCDFAPTFQKQFTPAHLLTIIPHKRKYWRVLYLAIWLQTGIQKYWRKLNLEVGRT